MEFLWKEYGENTYEKGERKIFEKILFKQIFYEKEDMKNINRYEINIYLI